MKENELRLGNLIIEDGKQTEFNGDFYHWIDGLIKPIPLTDELLIKLGFESDGIEWWNSIIILAISTEGLWYCPTEQPHCLVGQKFEYVHQLQNLHYAITGDELNVLI